MTSSCLLLLSVLFPLKYSVSAEATSCNGGLTLGQTGRGIDAGQVGSNVEDMVTPMHATSVQGSNSGGTTDFKSWKVIVVAPGTIVTSKICLPSFGYQRKNTSVAGAGDIPTILLGMQ
ncbi:hypothetical protein CJ030_MR2G028601 [Morella rubra]|uniref:Uncharacterized protein n=1 Tax=Morella rubra TaxID=262757 RepID=A0A6A1WBR2_9ROSI|nr:hypothetical protein CJ030_MR2G028601 [Morella rubra]